MRTCFEYTMRPLPTTSEFVHGFASRTRPGNSPRTSLGEDATLRPQQPRARDHQSIYSLDSAAREGAWRLAPRVGCYPQHYEDTGALRSCDVIGAHTRSAGGNSLGRHAGHGHFGPDARPFLDMSIFTLGCLPCRDGWWASVP